MTRPGALFMIGVHGTRPTRRMVSLLRGTRASSVLLLGRNIESAAQVKALTAELVQRLGRPVLFAVDHEGGWVLRFKAGVTAFPGNCALGRAGDPALARETGRRMGDELAALGIRLNLAPVLDVLGPDYNPGIGIRSFGSDPALAARLGAAFIRGLQERGVSACAKHFPGKGAATVDAHVDLPTIRLPRAAFERVHLAPFTAAVRAGVHGVMTSHVRYPALDREISTFSRRITRGILREEMGFDGLVISDDLCMGAITKRMPVQQAAVGALNAGHDMLIIAHDEQAMLEAPHMLEAALQAGEVEEEQLSRSLERIHNLLFMKRPPLKRPSFSQAEALSRRVARAGLRLVQKGALALPLAPEKERLLVLFPDFSQVADRFTFEDGPREPEKFLRRRLEEWGPHRLLRAPVAAADASALAPAVDAAGRVLFFCFEARRFPGQKAVLDLLARRAPGKTAACLIRSPRDLDLLPRAMAALDAAGYRRVQFEAALDRLLGP